MHGSEEKPIETLRISDRDRTKLIDQVEAASTRAVKEDRRRLRVAYNECKAVLTLHNESGNSTRFVVMPRNLSRLGVAFVHGRFVFNNTRCEIMLQSLDDKWHAINGRVLSCRHVQGMVHEIAVVFDDAIDLPMFADLTPEQEMMNIEDVTRDLPPEEVAKVQRMAGRVLVVDSFPVDRKLFSLWLSRSGFKTESAVSVDGALTMVDRECYDLVLVEMHLGDENGGVLISRLKAVAADTPVLAMSADEGEPVRAAAEQAGADGLLAKPFTEQQLIQQCHKLLGTDADDGSDVLPIYSSSADDEELKPLLAEFIRGLNGQMTRLREANAHKDRQALLTIARTLKGAGSGYGLTPISERAADVLKQLDDEHGPIDELRKEINELIQVLNRVRL